MSIKFSVKNIILITLAVIFTVLGGVGVAGYLWVRSLLGGPVTGPYSVRQTQGEQKESKAAEPGEDAAQAEENTGESGAVTDHAGQEETGKVEKAQEVKQPTEKPKPKSDLADVKVPVPVPVKPAVVEAKAEEVAGRDVELADYIKAGTIVLGKLSFKEIQFLFDSAKDDLFVNTPVEELERIRKIVFSKLGEGDIAALREIGRKYGKEMKILDPELDVAAEKERKMKLKAEKSE